MTIRYCPTCDEMREFVPVGQAPWGFDDYAEEPTYECIECDYEMEIR